MAKSSIFTAFDELARVLDIDHAQGIIDHRSAKRAKLTPLAAKLLAREFERCPDPNAAAEYMLVMGWQGFKAEWMAREAPGITGPALNGIDAARADLRRRIEDEQRSASQGSLHPGDGQHLLAGSTRH